MKVFRQEMSWKAAVEDIFVKGKFVIFLCYAMMLGSVCLSKIGFQQTSLLFKVFEDIWLQCYAAWK